MCITLYLLTFELHWPVGCPFWKGPLPSQSALLSLLSVVWCPLQLATSLFIPNSGSFMSKWKALVRTEILEVHHFLLPFWKKKCPCIHTACFLFFNHFPIHNRTCPHVQWLLYLFKSFWRGAFWKSKYTVSTGSLLSACLLIAKKKKTLKKRKTQLVLAKTLLSLLPVNSSVCDNFILQQMIFWLVSSRTSSSCHLPGCGEKREREREPASQHSNSSGGVW